MTRAVLDTNIFVSGLIRRIGTPGRVLAQYRAGRFELVTSPALLEELESVLCRPHILPLIHATVEEVQAFIVALANESHVVRPLAEVNAVRDPADNRVLEAATEGRAEVIVSGDLDLTTLGEFEGIPIVGAGRF